GARAPRGPTDGEQELLVSQDLGSPELEHPADIVPLDGAGERQRDVIYPDRLCREAAVPEHRDGGGPAVQARQQLDGRALGPVDDRRLEDRVRQSWIAAQLFRRALG